VDARAERASAGRLRSSPAGAGVEGTVERLLSSGFLLGQRHKLAGWHGVVYRANAFGGIDRMNERQLCAKRARQLDTPERKAGG
jgi:hypothetical protein